MEYLLYTGKKLFWKDGVKTLASFDATSGHGVELSEDREDYQKPSEQCVPWEGPIPEGTYKVDTWINAKVPNYVVSDGVCQLRRQRGVQVVPMEKKSKPMAAGGSCIDLWGPNRVNLHPYDKKTLNSCSPRRNGFYIHDSSKGGSSGCIEIGVGFFKKLREWVKANNGRNKHVQKLLLDVKYVGTSTRGATKK